jgi:hypothetical protein
MKNIRIDLNKLAKRKFQKTKSNDFQELIVDVTAVFIGMLIAVGLFWFGTLAVDLSILFFAGMIWSQKQRGLKLLFTTSLTGIIAAYTCLLRPAFLLPMALAMGVYVLFSVLRNNKDRGRLLSLVVFLVVWELFR